MVSSEKSSSGLSENTYLKWNKIFYLFIKMRFWWNIKMLGFFIFIKLLPKFNDFINVDDCIGKITSKSIRIYHRNNKKREYS